MTSTIDYKITNVIDADNSVREEWDNGYEEIFPCVVYDGIFLWDSLDSEKR